MMNLVKMYLNFIIKVNCTFRAPEVITPNYVELNKIELYSEINEKNNHINNRYGYNAMCRERVKLLTHNYNESIFKKILDLLHDGIIKKVAIHDDYDGLLATYEIIKSKEYSTIELGDEFSRELLGGLDF